MGEHRRRVDSRLRQLGRRAGGDSKQCEYSCAHPGIRGTTLDGRPSVSYSSKALANGQSREEVENTWENATKTAKRLALALAGNADDPVAVDKWKAGGQARRDTLAVVNKGIHQGVSDYKAAVNDARRAVGDLARGAS